MYILMDFILGFRNKLSKDTIKFEIADNPPFTNF